MVFDGMATKSKSGTEQKRKESRSAAKDKARQLLIEQRHDAAKKEFDKAVEIKHEHALAVMEACRSQEVDCITSMYEADAQLTYLNKVGIADYVISEDSDLIVFGCSKIIYKLQLDGTCMFYDSSKLHLSLNMSQEKFSFEKFRRIAILSGCDYLNSLPGIGLVKATKFFKMTSQNDLRILLPKVPSYLGLSKIAVDEDYIEGFLRAEATFKYMFVYDPFQRKMIRLNEFDDENELNNCINAGDEIDDDKAYQLALGNVDPRTFKTVADFDPKQLQWQHPSIWTSQQSNYLQSKKSPKNDKKVGRKLLPADQIADVKIREIIKCENSIEINFIDRNEDEEIVKSYANQVSFEASKIEQTTCEEKQNAPSTSRKNPFAKKIVITKEKKIDESAAGASLLSKLTKSKESSVAPTQVTFSRFFQKKSEDVNVKDILEEKLEERLEENKYFYQVYKYSFQDDDKNKERETENKDPTKPSFSIPGVKRINSFETFFAGQIEKYGNEEPEQKPTSTQSNESKLSKFRYKLNEKCDSEEIMSDKNDVDDIDSIIKSQLSVLKELSKPSQKKTITTSKLSLKRKSTDEKINSQAKLAKFGFTRNMTG